MKDVQKNILVVKATKPEKKKYENIRTVFGVQLSHLISKITLSIQRAFFLPFFVNLTFIQQSQYVWCVIHKLC